MPMNKVTQLNVAHATIDETIQVRAAPIMPINSNLRARKQ